MDLFVSVPEFTYLFYSRETPSLFLMQLKNTNILSIPIEGPVINLNDGSLCG